MAEYIHRNIDSELIAWKEDSMRKPLLLRGARQVGKSSAVKNLGKQFGNSGRHEESLAIHEREKAHRSIPLFLREFWIILLH